MSYIVAKQYAEKQKQLKKEQEKKNSENKKKKLITMVELKIEDVKTGDIFYTQEKGVRTKLTALVDASTYIINDEIHYSILIEDERGNIDIVSTEFKRLYFRDEK